MKRAVAFDLWETLITEPRSLSLEQERLRLDRIGATLARHACTRSADRIEHAYRALWTRCHELYWAHDRDTTTRDQVLHMVHALELDPDEVGEECLAAIEEDYAGAALEVPPHLVPGAGEILRWLKEQGFATGLISNTGRTPGHVLRRVLDQAGLGEFLDVKIFSNEHGECKPQRSIFDKLVAQLDCNPTNIVFVGDNLYADIHGAQQAGMKAVYFLPEIRGMAFAPPSVREPVRVTPDAEIRTLLELPPLLPELLD